MLHFVFIKQKWTLSKIIKLSEIIKLVGVSGIARVLFLNDWKLQSEKSPFWISLIIAKSTHFRQQKRPFYRGFRHNNQTVRNNQTGLLKTLMSDSQFWNFPSNFMQNRFAMELFVRHYETVCQIILLKTTLKPNKPKRTIKYIQ